MYFISGIHVSMSNDTEAICSVYACGTHMPTRQPMTFFAGKPCDPFRPPHQKPQGLWVNMEWIQQKKARQNRQRHKAESCTCEPLSSETMQYVSHLASKQQICPCFFSKESSPLFWFDQWATFDHLLHLLQCW